MTNEEAIAIIEHRDDIMDYCESRQLAEALDVAVAALKAQPCEDVVSLDGVINTIEWYRTNPQHFTEDNLIEDIKGLPSVIPKPTECEDCVSRESVLDALHVEGRPTKRFDYVIEVRRDIEALPPVTPKQKTGKWTRKLIRNEKGGCIGAKMICSECGNDNKHDEYMDYCPNCGIKMRGESDE